MKGKEGKLSKLLPWLKVFLSSSRALGNNSSFNNSKGFDDLVELEKYLPKKFLSSRIGAISPEMSIPAPVNWGSCLENSYRQSRVRSENSSPSIKILSIPHLSGPPTESCILSWMGTNSITWFVSNLRSLIPWKVLFPDTTAPKLPNFVTISDKVAWSIFTSKFRRIFPQNLLKELMASSLIIFRVGPIYSRPFSQSIKGLRLWKHL